MHPTRLLRAALALLTTLVVAVATALGVALVAAPGSAAAHSAVPYSNGHPRDARITIPAIGIHRRINAPLVG